MRWIWLVAAISACGRIGFDASSHVEGDALRGDDATGDAELLDPDLIAWFPMDNDPSQGVLDRTHNGHDGVCVTTCPAAIAGVRGGGLLFDAVGDGIRVVDEASLHLSRGTVALWARVDVPPPSGLMELIGKPFGAAGRDTWEVYFDHGTGKLSFGGDAGSGGYLATSVTLGVWVHLAMTWDGSSFTVYRDGGMLGVTVASFVYDTNPIFLGAETNTGAISSRFHGALDDVRVYRRPLLPAEITALATP